MELDHISRFKADRAEFSPVAGRFHHVSISGTGHLYLIGGAARGLLQSTLRGTQTTKPNDYDWTVIGCCSKREAIHLDRSPRGINRIELEHGAPHPSLQDYFESRDFAINEVAVDSKGFIFATKIAVRSYRSNTLLVRPGKQLTLREAVRACRFCLEYKLKMPTAVKAQVKALAADMIWEPVFDRYTRSWNITEFINTL